MRLRLSDAATFALWAEHYHWQAEVCHQIAWMTMSPFKEVWLELAEEWTNLGVGSAGGRARYTQLSQTRFRGFWRD